MKGHPHEFGHTASWSCVAIASSWACKQNDRRPLLWYHRLAPPTRMRCYARNEATAAWLVAGLY